MNTKKLLLIIGLGLMGTAAQATETGITVLYNPKGLTSGTIEKISNPEHYIHELNKGVHYDALNVPFKAYSTSLLIVASRMGHEQLVTAILKKLPHKNKKQHINLQEHNNEFSALHYACTANHLEVVRLLVEAGADLEIENDDNITPFLAAVSDGHIAVADYLKMRGANIHHKAHGIGALTLSIGYQEKQMEKWLTDECKLTLTKFEQAKIQSLDPKRIEHVIAKYGVSSETYADAESVEALIQTHSAGATAPQPKKSARKRSPKELAKKKQKALAKQEAKLATEQAHRQAESAHDRTVAIAAQVAQELAAEEEYNKTLEIERIKLSLQNTLNAMTDRTIARDQHVSNNYKLNTCLNTIEDRLKDIFERKG